jgi:hypothetical protein
MQSGDYSDFLNETHCSCDGHEFIFSENRSLKNKFNGFCRAPVLIGAWRKMRIGIRRD